MVGGIADHSNQGADCTAGCTVCIWWQSDANIPYSQGETEWHNQEN